MPGLPNEDSRKASGNERVGKSQLEKLPLNWRYVFSKSLGTVRSFAVSPEIAARKEDEDELWNLP